MKSLTALRRASLAAALFVVAGLVFVGCDSDDPEGVTADVKVMSYNLYLGGDLFPVTEATNNDELIQRVTALWATIQASRFDLRAEAIADIIEAEEPDLIGLQEVSLYRTQTPSNVVTGTLTPDATEVSIDFLAILMAELDARGLGYRVVLEEENADVELAAALVPGPSDPADFVDVRLTDRDVILARAGVETDSPGTLTFNAQAAVEVPPGSGNEVEFTRSAQWVEATVEDVTFTFANAHLEVDDGNPDGAALAQLGQANELREALASASNPLVLVGDFNSPADGSGTVISTSLFTGTTYDLLTNFYTDAFGTATAPTCCQDGDLLNTTSDLSSRIDLILYRGSVETLDTDVVGDERVDLGGPQWPSDHAGVVATLRIEN